MNPIRITSQRAKNLTEAKKLYPLLKTVNAQVLQQVLGELIKAPRFLIAAQRQLKTKYYRLSLGNEGIFILKLIKMEPHKSVLAVARSRAKSRYRKEFTGVILAATSNRETRHRQR